MVLLTPLVTALAASPKAVVETPVRRPLPGYVVTRLHLYLAPTRREVLDKTSARRGASDAPRPDRTYCANPARLSSSSGSTHLKLDALLVLPPVYFAH
jgi:hypothetical protein